VTGRSGRALPHPLFCVSCPYARDGMPDCVGYEPTGAARWGREVVHCQHFVVEMTVDGPLPGCTRPSRPADPGR
jgi:hypothetical protein